MDIVIDEKIAGKTIRAFTRGDLGFSSAILKKLKLSNVRMAFMVLWMMVVTIKAVWRKQFLKQEMKA